MMPSKCDSCGEHALVNMKYRKKPIVIEAEFIDKEGKEIDGRNSQWVQWISVKDRLPEYDLEVLYVNGKNQVSIGIRFDEEKGKLDV